MDEKKNKEDYKEFKEFQELKKKERILKAEESKLQIKEIEERRARVDKKNEDEKKLRDSEIKRNKEEVEKNKRVINLLESSSARVLKNNELLQIDEYEQCQQSLEYILEDKGSFKDLDHINECQVHNTIFISGERGSGKTTFLKNIKSFVTGENGNECVKKELQNKFEFLDIIDPTLLHNNEDFTTIIISHIANYIEEQYINKSYCRDMDKKKDEIDKYFKKLKAVSESLDYAKKGEGESGVEKIVNNQTSLLQAQKIHDYFKVITEICGCKVLVLPIDDIDMSFEHGFEVLECIRKFLSSPYIIPIVSGDFALYSTIVEKKFAEQVQSEFIKSESGDKELFRGSSNWDEHAFLHAEMKGTWQHKGYKKGDNDKVLGFDSQDWKARVRDLTDKYFYKVFPNDKRIELPTIKDIINQNYINNKASIENTIKGIKIKYAVDKEEDLKLIYKMILNSFNSPIKTNGLSSFDDEYILHIIPLDSLRSFVQFLTQMRPFIDDILNSKKYKDRNKHIEYCYTPSKSFFRKISSFYANVYDKQFEYLSAQSNYLSITTNTIYQNNTETSFENLIYSNFFNPLINPRNKPHLEPINKDELNNNKKNKNIKEEKYKNLFISKREFNKLAKNKNYIPIFGDLFTYKDYFTKYKSKYFFVAGKFIEFIFSSFDNKFNLNQIINIIKDEKVSVNGVNKNAPLLKIPESNYFNIDENDDEDDDEIPDINITSHKYSELERIISDWKSPVYIEDIYSKFTSSYFLYKVINKFMNNYLILCQNIELKDESLYSMIKRICYILLNSVAFFEKINNNGINYEFGALKKVSETNIASGKSIKNIKNDNAYSLNIAPLLRSPSNYLTKEIYSHPLILLFMFDKFNGDNGYNKYKKYDDGHNKPSHNESFHQSKFKENDFNQIITTLKECKLGRGKSNMDEIMKKETLEDCYNFLNAKATRNEKNIRAKFKKIIKLKGDNSMLSEGEIVLLKKTFKRHEKALEENLRYQIESLLKINEIK